MPRFTHENLSRPVWGRLFLGPTVEVDYATAVEKSFIRQLVGEFAFLVKLRVYHDILPTNSFVLANLIVLPKRELYKVEFLRGDLWAIGKIVNDYEAQEILKQLAFVSFHSRVKTIEAILAKRDRVRGGAQEFQGTFWDRSPKRGHDVERFDDELFDLINTVPEEMGYEINITEMRNSHSTGEMLEYDASCAPEVRESPQSTRDFI